MADSLFGSLRVRRTFANARAPSLTGHFTAWNRPVWSWPCERWDGARQRSPIAYIGPVGRPQVPEALRLRYCAGVLTIQKADPCEGCEGHL